MAEYSIEELGGEVSAADIEALAEVIRAVVHDGASVSFILPFTHEDARAFWTGNVLPKVASGGRRLLIARSGGRIVGTVQLDLAMPPNQPHRAEVAKLLVHPDARRRGIGRALMIEVERIARDERRSLITLDTRTGDNAEPLYLSLGYHLAGVIPGYARGPHSPALEPTSILYKVLGA